MSMSDMSMIQHSQILIDLPSTEEMMQKKEAADLYYGVDSNNWTSMIDRKDF